MNSRQKLEKALEHLINEDTATANQLLKEYIIECAAEIHQGLIEESEEDIFDMERDALVVNDHGDHLADEIAADKEEIESEEAFNEADESVEDAVEDLDADLESEDLDLEDVKDDVDAIEDRVEEIELSVDEFAELAAQFQQLVGVEELEHGEDFNDDGEIGLEDELEGEVDVVDGEAEVLDGEADLDDGLEELDESVKLTAVKADNKDVSSKDKSPVAHKKDKALFPGGEPVVLNKGEKNQGHEAGGKVAKTTVHDNIVKNASELLKPVKKQ